MNSYFIQHDTKSAFKGKLHLKPKIEHFLVCYLKIITRFFFLFCFVLFLFVFFEKKN